MTPTEQIQETLRRLPTAFQVEVLDFVEYLLMKAEREAFQQEERAWAKGSVVEAMRGMDHEEAPLYTASDLKVVF